MTLVGVISDTHGLLRPEAVQALQGVKQIIHAGDIGTQEVVDALRELAPVTAVRGNCDRGDWAQAYPPRQDLLIGAVSILVLHDRNELQTLPPGKGVQVVVSGHSHRPKIQEKDGVLYLNPGSAGPRRFKLPVTLALLTVQGEQVSAEIVDLM